MLVREAVSGVVAEDQILRLHETCSMPLFTEQPYRFFYRIYLASLLPLVDTKDGPFLKYYEPRENVDRCLQLCHTRQGLYLADMLHAAGNRSIPTECHCKCALCLNLPPSTHRPSRPRSLVSDMAVLDWHVRRPHA